MSFFFFFFFCPWLYSEQIKATAVVESFINIQNYFCMLSIYIIYTLQVAHMGIIQIINVAAFGPFNC